MTRLLPLLLLVASACGNGAKPAPESHVDDAEPPAPAPAEAPSHPPDTPPAPKPVVPKEVPEGAVVTGEPMTGMLVLGATHVAVGEPLLVRWHLAGTNGCYRQTDVTTTLDGQDITHSYTTSTEGEVCTANIVPGGFETTITLDTVGDFTGHIVVNGEERTTYRVLTTPQ